MSEIPIKTATDIIMTPYVLPPNYGNMSSGQRDLFHRHQYGQLLLESSKMKQQHAKTMNSYQIASDARASQLATQCNGLRTTVARLEQDKAQLLVGYRELQNKAALLERTIGHYQQLPQDVLEPEVEILEGPTPAKTVRPDDDNSSTEATT